MAKALKCDNCGQYFGYIKGSLNPRIAADANTIAFCVSDENGLMHIVSYDICPDCLKKLLTAMPGLAKKEERK